MIPPLIVALLDCYRFMIHGCYSADPGAVCEECERVSLREHGIYVVVVNSERGPEPVE